MLPALTNHLSQLGMPPRMAEVYVFLTERGEAGANDIAQTFDLTRSTAHDVLCSLVRFGFATSFRRGRERRFAMESPETMHRAIDAERKIAEDRAHAFEAIAPSLHALHARGNRQTGIRYFSKQEEIDAAREAFQHEDVMELVDGDLYCNDVTSRRTIVVTHRSMLAANGVRTISPTIISMSGQTLIAEDRVLFIPTGETPVAIEIRCRSIAGMCKFAFELSWRAAEQFGNT